MHRKTLDVLLLNVVSLMFCVVCNNGQTSSQNSFREKPSEVKMKTNVRKCVASNLREAKPNSMHTGWKSGGGAGGLLIFLPKSLRGSRLSGKIALGGGDP
jgi:hypothetical protein